MNVFDKRPLSLILCITLGGFVLFALLSEAFKIAITVIGICLLAFGMCVNKAVFERKKLTILCAVALLFASLASYFYFDC